MNEEQKEQWQLEQIVKLQTPKQEREALVREVLFSDGFLDTQRTNFLNMIISCINSLCVSLEVPIEEKNKIKMAKRFLRLIAKNKPKEK